MRTAIYTRISRDDAGEGLGVERQEQDCRRLALKRGWTVRSPRDLEDFIDLLDESGVRVETVKAGAFDVSMSHGRLTARILGNMAPAESERSGERVQRAHQQAKEKGFWRGPIPYGMRPTTVPGSPEPDPELAGVVEDMFTRILRGDSLCAIAKDLNDQGVLPKRGKLWTHTGAMRLIQSPVLGGLVRVDGELREGVFEGVVDAVRWKSAQTSIARAGRAGRSARRERPSPSWVASSRAPSTATSATEAAAPTRVCPTSSARLLLRERLRELQLVSAPTRTRSSRSAASAGLAPR